MSISEEVLDHPVSCTETDASQKDLDDFLKLFQEISESLTCVKDNLVSVNEKVCKGEISSAKGISLLEVKNQMLLSYLSNLLLVILRKCFGKSIAGDPVIDRLVEIRTVIERIQPIENKLKYQIDKLVQIAATGLTDANDPKQFRANPANLVDGVKNHEANSNEDDDEDSDKDGEHLKKDQDAGKTDKKSKSGLYVPPKLVPVHYDEDNNKKERQLERARKRALNSSVMEELHEEYLDTPVEVGEAVSFKPKRSKFAREKQEYEEMYFTRLPASKKEKHVNRSMVTTGNLDRLTNFEDISVLQSGLNYSPAKKKVKLGITKNKKIKKGFKNKRKKFH